MKLIVASIHNDERIVDKIECPAFSYSKEEDEEEARVDIYESVKKSMVDIPYKTITNVVAILCRES